MACNFSLSGAEGTTSGTTRVLAVPIVPASTERTVKSITVYNNDTKNGRVIVEKFNGSTYTIVVNRRLRPKETLEFDGSYMLTAGEAFYVSLEAAVTTNEFDITSSWGEDTITP